MACRRCSGVEAKFEVNERRRSTRTLAHISSRYFAQYEAIELRSRTSSEERTATKAAPLIGDDLGGAQEKGCEVELCVPSFMSDGTYPGVGYHYKLDG